MTDKKIVSLLGFASGIAAGNPGCGDGPLALQRSNIFSAHHVDNVIFQWHSILFPENNRPVFPAVVRLCDRLAQETQQLSQQKQAFLVIGGDHSCAIGTWSGVYGAVANQGPIGLIWIDAHMDSHTMETSESGNLHGMPLAVLLGYGDPALTDLVSKHPKLLPQHVCLIGIRSFEAAEAALLKQLGVRVYMMDEVKQRGISVVLQEAKQIVQQGTVGYGMSIDLDGFDPADAPGVGTPEPNGIDATAFCQAIQHITWDPQFLGMEIVEFNPHVDEQKNTEKTISHLIEAAFAMKELRYELFS